MPDEIQTIRVVLPETKVVRINVSSVPSGSVRVVDLGIVDIRTAFVKGRTNILVPYADGRIIKSVRYIPGGAIDFTQSPLDMYFVTPNIAAPLYDKSTAGLAEILNDGDYDTFGLAYSPGQGIGLKGNAATVGSDNSQILDCGPLIAAHMSSNINAFFPLLSWQAGRSYIFGDTILDENDHLQSCSVNGIAGSVEPTWNDSGGATTDGTATFTDKGVIPIGTVHAIAEVIEGISPMPPYPAAIEFVAPPVDTPAGVPMPDITIIVKDQNGNPYKFTRCAVFFNIVGDGVWHGETNGQAASVTDVTTGISTFSGLQIDVSGTYVVKAFMYPCMVANPILSSPFNITP